MTPFRAVGTASLLLAATLALAGCGEDSDAPAAERSPEVSASTSAASVESGDEPSPGSTSTPAAPVDDKAEIKAVIAAYDRALVTLNREREVTPELEAVATDAWAQQLVTTYDDNLFSHGLQMLGRWRTKVESVTIDGGRAEADVCFDGNKVYVVEGDSIPSGTPNQGRSPGTISLVREDDGWQIDGNTDEEGTC